MIEHSIFVEKYRPKTLDEFIGNENLRDKVQSMITQNDISHLLLYGSAGTGKTSLAKIIAKNTDCDYMYINASDENNVDTVRNKIKDFASSVSFKSFKLIILDECLEENTLITILRDGGEVQIPIKDVDENNDLVKSWNLEKELWQYRPFYLVDNGEQEVYEISLENGEIVMCTNTHKWYVMNENNEIVVVKTEDLHKFNHILSP